MLGTTCVNGGDPARIKENESGEAGDNDHETEPSDCGGAEDDAGDDRAEGVVAAEQSPVPDRFLARTGCIGRRHRNPRIPLSFAVYHAPLGGVLRGLNPKD